MGDETYRATLKALEAEHAEVTRAIEGLDHQRNALLARHVQLTATIKTLTALLENSPPDAGLADTCRLVLTEAKGRPMTPTMVRDAVVRKGYDVTKHTNPMASVHAVLKRLAATPGFDSIGGKGLLYRYRPNKTG